MTPLKKKTAAIFAAAALSGVVLGGTAVATAADPSSSISSATQGGRPAPHEHTTVTGDELVKVSDAVRAKVAGLTITSVQQDPDGSYDVAGTLDGTQQVYDVSADLTTITERVGGPGRHGGPAAPGGPGGHEHTAVTGDTLAAVTKAVSTKYADLTIRDVRQDPDGSFDVMATDSSGRPVMVEVSQDLGTITQRTDLPPAPPTAGTTPAPGAPSTGQPSAKPTAKPSQAVHAGPRAKAKAKAKTKTIKATRSATTVQS